MAAGHGLIVRRGSSFVSLTHRRYPAGPELLWVAAQVGVLQVSAAQVGAAPTAEAQIGAVQVGTGQVGVA